MEPVSVRALQHGKTPVPAPLTRRLMGKLGVAALVGGLAMPGDAPKQEAIYSHDPVAHSSQPHVQHAWEEIKSGRKMVFYSYRYRLFYYGYAKKGHWGMGQAYADVGKITIATTLLIRGKLYQKGQEWELPEHLDAWQRENMPHAPEGNAMVANIETAHAELARMFHDDSLVFVGFVHSKHEKYEDNESPQHHNHNYHAGAEHDSLGYLGSLSAGHGHNPFWWLSHFGSGYHAHGSHHENEDGDEAHREHHETAHMSHDGHHSHHAHATHHSHDPHAGHEYHASGEHDPWAHIGMLGLGHGHDPLWMFSHFGVKHHSSHHSHEGDEHDAEHATADSHPHHVHVSSHATHLTWHDYSGSHYAHEEPGHEEPHVSLPRIRHEHHELTVLHVAHVLAGIHTTHKELDHDGNEQADHTTSHTGNTPHQKHRGTSHEFSIGFHAEHNAEVHANEPHEHFVASELEADSFHLPSVPLSVIMGAERPEMSVAKVASASASPENPKS